mgnify:CR=1 FL=1
MICIGCPHLELLLLLQQLLACDVAAEQQVGTTLRLCLFNTLLSLQQQQAATSQYDSV